MEREPTKPDLPKKVELPSTVLDGEIPHTEIKESTTNVIHNPDGTATVTRKITYFQIFRLAPGKIAK